MEARVGIGGELFWGSANLYRPSTVGEGECRMLQAGIEHEDESGRYGGWEEPHQLSRLEGGLIFNWLYTISKSAHRPHGRHACLRYEIASKQRFMLKMNIRTMKEKVIIYRLLIYSFIPLDLSISLYLESFPWLLSMTVERWLRKPHTLVYKLLFRFLT